MAEELKKSEGTPTNPTVSGTNVGPSGQGSKNGIGLEPNIVGVLSYIFTPISSIVFLITEKGTSKWEEEKMYVMQSLFIGVIQAVCWMTSFLICPLFISIALFIYQIYLAVKAYQGEKVAVPLIKDWVK